MIRQLQVLAVLSLVLVNTSLAQDDVLTTYLTTVADMNEGYFVTDPQALDNVTYQQGTAIEELQANRDAYQSRLDTLNALEVPDEAADIHPGYVDTLARAVVALDAAIAAAEPTAAAESGPAYLYHGPDFGYVFDDENASICALKAIAREHGITDFPSLLCDRVLDNPQGETAGSPDAPVQEVYIVHEAGCNGMCPGITYAVSTIYARAGEPLTITFENRNPLPFLFNLAVYRGYDPTQRLTGENLIVSTNAGGPRTHTVSLTLEPGLYTFADNVHPGVMQGQIIVVE